MQLARGKGTALIQRDAEMAFRFYPARLRTPSLRGVTRKLIRLLAVLVCFLSSTISHAADTSKCKDSFRGASADELSDCIKEINQKLVVLETRMDTISSAAILAAGHVEPNSQTKDVQVNDLFGPVKATASFSPGSTNLFIIKLIGANLAKRPVVILGSIKHNSAVELNSFNGFDEFIVSTIDAQNNPVPTPFWFVVISEQQR